MDMWEYRRRVRYYETDRMGVVHHSNYLRLLEDARMDWIRDHVMNYCDMEKMGIIIPAVSATEQFMGFLRYDDEFSVRMKLVGFTGVRMEFEYEIMNITGDEVCFRGSSVHCFTKDGDYKPISVKRKHPEIFAKFMENLQKGE
ncbi:MAG: acyl-CoA thioesterase [Clostridiales bacterium]|nr:acyl-CoA thioesterase [Clostridiales bacterium]MDD7015625.1 thioesterase family protein [Bacillota bacterium]MDY4960077.1 thioesterase family protein [Lentihominibacter sp.]